MWSLGGHTGSREPREGEVGIPSCGSSCCSSVQPTLSPRECDESTEENLRPPDWKRPFKVILSNHPAYWGLDLKGSW